MFVVKLNEERFEYDVHSIVKAFYPEENVRTLTPQTVERKRAQLSEKVRMEIELKPEGAVVFVGEKRFEWDAAEGNEEVLAEQIADEAAESSVATNRQQTECAETEQSDREAFKRKVYKDGFKRFLYRTLSECTGKELPWGNLTGIRPTKIAMGLLEEGKTDTEVTDFMKQSHYVSAEKAELALDIAKREKKLLSAIHYQDGYSLYIGIPFCPTTCLYCSFTSYPICAYRERVEEYIDCLIKEMEYVSGAYRHKILDTVYIGGGTPTTLEPAQLRRMIEKLKELFDFSTVTEFTVEAGRADSITEEKLAVLKELGVTRISVNPQTMKDETLKLIGRQHTVAQVEEAFLLARRVGFTNINMDLILGLPGEDEADVAHTITRVKELAPDSLTVHSLAIKRASRLNRWIEENGVSTLKNTDETMRIAAEGARELDMKPYYLYRQKNMSGNFENVGYAKEGCFGVYNILIMEEKQTIAALGAGSISKVVFPDGRIERADNVKDVALYIEKIDEMIERKRELFALEQ